MPSDGRRVEVAGGLVGQQDRRPVDEGAGDRDALLLAAGQLVRAGASPCRPGRPGRARLGHGGEDVVPRLADHLQREGDVLEDGLVRQQPEVLEDGADLAAQLRHLPARQRGRGPCRRRSTVPRLAPLLPQHEAQEGRLAGAGGTDEEDELAALDLQGHLVQRGPCAARVDLGHVLEPDHDRPRLVLRAGRRRGRPRAASLIEGRTGRHPDAGRTRRRRPVNPRVRTAPSDSSRSVRAPLRGAGWRPVRRAAICCCCACASGCRPR